jgi:hypothetical protein
MAYTATLNKKTVFGDQRVQQYVVSADAASGTVSTGFAVITQLQWAQKSITTALLKVRMNALADGTAANGTVGISGAVSGDEIYLTVYGR